MEVENSHRTPSSKRHRHANLMGERDDNEDDEDAATAAEATTAILLNNNNNNNSRILRQWHQPASRIYRVSRASGGKDRHSKVYTAKGLRDRRVRLSVSTAIQFYDLQDRLGYDQPSKAIEWLIKAAASAIAELPSLDTVFPPDDSLAHPKQEMVTHIADVEAEPSYNQQSSTSETSKGSVLSLTSRSEVRVKARERARERAAKDKDGEKGHVVSLNAQNLNMQSSFTELLTGGGGGLNAAATNTREGNSGGGNFFQRHMAPVTSTADYFTQFGQQQQLKSSHDHHQSIPSEFFGNNNNNNNNNNNSGISCPIGMVPFGDHHQHHHPAEMQQFAFLQQDHFFPVAVANGGGDNYSLNFSISSGLTGFHRGTLQSNSPSLHHQFPHHHHHHHQHIPVQRLSSQLDGASVPFLFGTAASVATSAHEGQFPAGFDGNLQLCDGYKHLDMKGKGKG